MSEKKGRVIVNNWSSLDDVEAVRRVATVMDGGRKSNHGNQYCYHSVFKDGITVSSFLNKTSDSFDVRGELAEADD